MAIELEIRERQKQYLSDLLTLKKLNKDTIKGLDEVIERVVVGMEQEDVALVEKIKGISAL